MSLVTEFEFLISYIGQISEKLEEICHQREILNGITSGILSGMIAGPGYKGIIISLFSTLSGYCLTKAWNTNFYVIIEDLREIMKVLKLITISIDENKTITQLPSEMVKDIIQVKKETKPLPCYNYLEYNNLKKYNIISTSRCQCQIVSLKLKKKINENKEYLNYLKREELFLYLDHLYDYLGMLGVQLNR